MLEFLTHGPFYLTIVQYAWKEKHAMLLAYLDISRIILSEVEPVGMIGICR